MPAATPLSRYVAVQQKTDREMAALLREAANDAEKMMLSLARKQGLGATIRRAQLGGILKELRKQQANLWGSITKATEMGMLRAGEAAAEAEIAINRYLFDKAGLVMADFDEAMRIQASESIANVVSRGANGIPLSDQVYKTRAWSNNLLNRTIDKGILLGMSADELAAAVKHLISPGVRGGVDYAAKRLARTELNNAFHRTQIDLRKGDPWSEGFQWHLSGSHPRPDACNQYAEGTHTKGGDPGVFSVNNVPGKPHPQCLCYITTVTIPVEDFINGMASGKFDKFMNEKIDTYGV